MTLQIRMTNGAAGGSHQVTIFDAVDKQLGLKLTATKTPLPVLIVDSAAKPSANLPGVAESLAVEHPKEFDVASIKPIDSTGPGPLRIQVRPGGGVDFSGLPLQTYILQAYQIQNPRLIIPPEMKDAVAKRYDTIAKAPSAGPEAAPSGGPAMPTPSDNDAAWSMMRVGELPRRRAVGIGARAALASRGAAPFRRSP